MQIKRNGDGLLVNSNDCAIAAFVMFMSFEPITIALSKFVPNPFPSIVAYLLMYVPLFLTMYLQKRIPWDFFLLYTIIILIFSITYLFHPEYKEWFFEGSYRLTRRIFRPDRYLYMYLFIRIFDDPKALLRAFKYAASVLLLYNTYLLFVALRRGYWIINSFGYDMQYSYDLNYGYSHLVIFATFMVLGFRENKKRYYFIGLLSMIEVVLGGSRGPIIYMVLLVAFLYFYKMRDSHSKKQIIMAVVAIIGAGIVFTVGFDNLTKLLGYFLSSIGFGGSRTVQNLINGSISDDNGRMAIWAIAINMIKENGIFGLGYGAYGDRYVIRPLYIWVGYCHNIFLELLIDYGIIIGCILIYIGLRGALKMLLIKQDTIWRDLFLIMFIGSCKLLLSGSYWYSEAFWGALAIGISYVKYRKKYHSFILQGRMDVNE